MEDMKFFDKLKRGLCKPEDIEDYIHEWHTKNGAGVSIPKYLGMTERQYFDWGDDEGSLRKYYRTVKNPSKAASKDELK